MTAPHQPRDGVTADRFTGIERAVARSEIIEILHTYARIAVEQADFAAMSRLFHNGGQFILPDQTAVPCTEIHRVVNGNEPTFVRHHITTIDIEFTSETTASTDSFFIAFTNLAAPDHWGRWSDKFERGDDGSWLLTQKAPIIEGFAPAGWVGTVLLPSLADDAEV